MRLISVFIVIPALMNGVACLGESKATAKTQNGINERHRCNHVQQRSYDHRQFRGATQPYGKGDRRADQEKPARNAYNGHGYHHRKDGENRMCGCASFRTDQI